MVAISTKNREKANEITTNGSSSLAYDAAGNMKYGPKSGEETTGLHYVYDAWNRLTAVYEDDGDGEYEPGTGDTLVAKHEYDGTARRIQIFTDFDGTTPDTVVDDYYCGQQVIESDKTVDSVRDGGYQYLWSPRYIDAAVLRDTLNTAGTGIVAAQRVYYLSDANYNVTGLVKYDSVTETWKVIERFAYSSYGKVEYYNADWSTATSSANANTILFTGRTLDLATGLYYYRARYYNANLGVFVGRDPIQADLNMYRYVGNEPINSTDPTGLKLHIDGDNKFRDYITRLLKQLCPLITVDKFGNVSSLSGPPESKNVTGCDCLGAIISNGFDNSINEYADIDPVSMPGGPGTHPTPSGSPGGGAKGEVAFNPRRCSEERQNGKWDRVPQYIVLGHELCGHILDFNNGTQPVYPDEETRSIPIENILRKDHRCPERPSNNADRREVDCDW